MNYQNKIFEMLGVKENEPFYLCYGDGSLFRRGFQFRLNYRLLVEKMDLEAECDAWERCTNQTYLQGILSGELRIKKMPLEPKSKEDRVVLDYAKLCGFRYVAKDKGGDVYAYSEMPCRKYNTWNPNGDGVMHLRAPLEFIQWEDEPFCLEDWQIDGAVTASKLEMVHQ